MTRRNRRIPIPPAVRRAMDAATQFSPDAYADIEAIAASIDTDLAGTLEALDGFIASPRELLREVTDALHRMPKMDRLYAIDSLARHFAQLAVRSDRRDRNVALCIGWQRLKTSFVMSVMTKGMRYAVQGTEPAIHAEIAASRDAAARAFWASGARLVGEVMPVEGIQVPA